MNHSAKFDAASFILGGKKRNRTNQHTKLQTVNDILSTHTLPEVTTAAVHSALYNHPHL